MPIDRWTSGNAARRGPRAGVPIHIAIVMLVAGCIGPRDSDVQIPFIASLGGAPFSCSAAHPGFSPSDLRLYLHDVALIDAEGRAAPVALADDQVWQSRGVALLDFESGRDRCANGTSGTHTTLTGRVAAGDYHALQFVVGVPFERNHADAATADAPLNLGRMHWGWQGGYKFLRFEGEHGGTPFRFHLGSTGCEGTIGQITRCTRPNRAPIVLAGFVPGRTAVRMELGALIGDVTAAAPRGCMSEHDDAGCHTPFAALGLDAASGLPSGQPTLFSLAEIATEQVASR